VLARLACAHREEERGGRAWADPFSGLTIGRTLVALRTKDATKTPIVERKHPE
jgi:hypothetical protein